MVQPSNTIVETLTGRARLRPSRWRLRPILQVEVERTSYRALDFEHTNPLHTWTKWRDATWDDAMVRGSFDIRPPFAVGGYTGPYTRQELVKEQTS